MLFELIAEMADDACGGGIISGVSGRCSQAQQQIERGGSPGGDIAVLAVTDRDQQVLFVERRPQRTVRVGETVAETIGECCGAMAPDLLLRRIK